MSQQTPFWSMGNQFVGASNHRLLGGAPPYLHEPLHDWSIEWRALAARAESLVANDPFAAAMVAAKIQSTHGPNGLRKRSLACLTDDAQTSVAERTLRRQVEAEIECASGRGADAAGVMRRLELERELDWLGTVHGEGYLVRQWKPGRLGIEFGTCWRLVRANLVSNPDTVLGEPQGNDDRLYHGWKLDADGAMIGMWVEDRSIDQWGFGDRHWTYIPLYSPDGSRNIIHRVGWRLPGMLRGVSMFAPMLLLAKQLQGTVEAHVTSKRAQACVPAILGTDDPDELAAAEKSGAKVGPNTQWAPLKTYVTKLGNTVVFPDFKFNGADLKDFLFTGYRLLSASWQMPVEVVLAQMGDSSLASARAGLDQYDRTGQVWQNDHIAECSEAMDENIVREAVAYGRIQPGPAGIKGLTAGRYQRPPKYSTDRLKDAQAAKQWIENGRSKTEVFDEYGFDFESSTEQKARDQEFEALNGIKPEPAAVDPKAPPAVDPAKDDQQQDDDAPVPAQGAAA